MGLLKKLLRILKPSNVKTKILLKKFLNFKPALPNPLRPSMTLKRIREPSKSNVPKSKVTLKKPKPPLNPKKEKPSVSKSNFNNLNKKPTEESPKKTKKLIMLEEMPPDLLNKSKLLLTLKCVPVVKPPAAARRWNLI